MPSRFEIWSDAPRDPGDLPEPEGMDRLFADWVRSPYMRKLIERMEARRTLLGRQLESAYGDKRERLLSDYQAASAALRQLEGVVVEANDYYREAYGSTED